MPPKPPDKESALRVRQVLAVLTRNRALFNRFQEKQYERARRYLLIGGAAGAAEPAEIFNDAIAKGIGGSYTWDLQDHPTFESYFRSVMWGVVGNYHGAADRKRTDRNTRVTEDSQEGDEENATPSVVAVASRQSDPAVAAESANDLDFYVEQLAAIHPNLARLYVLLRDGFTYKDVAVALGMPLEAVRALRRRLARALARLCAPPSFVALDFYYKE